MAANRTALCVPRFLGDTMQPPSLSKNRLVMHQRSFVIIVTMNVTSRRLERLLPQSRAFSVSHLSGGLLVMLVIRFLTIVKMLQRMVT